MPLLALAPSCFFCKRGRCMHGWILFGRNLIRLPLTDCLPPHDTFPAKALRDAEAPKHARLTTY